MLGITLDHKFDRPASNKALDTSVILFTSASANARAVAAFYWFESAFTYTAKSIDICFDVAISTCTCTTTFENHISATLVAEHGWSNGC